VAVAGQAAPGGGFGQHGKIVTVEAGALGQVLGVAERVFGTGRLDAPGGGLAHAFDHAQAEAQGGIVP
jgi:hypothetical protein